MEITQFTYFQQVGGIECDPVCAEITYGLERLAMYVQDVEFVYDLAFNEQFRYGEVFHQNEQEFSAYNFERADTEILFQHFKDAEKQCRELLTGKKLALPAYDQCIKASHAFNLLDARGVIQRHRTRRLYRAGARAGPGLLRSLAGDAAWAPTSPPQRGRLMPDLLLELFSEEIPARMQAGAARDLERLVVGALIGSRLAVRRHQGLCRTAAADPGGERACRPSRAMCARKSKAPRPTRPRRRMDGFLKKTGLTKDQLKIEKTPKGDVYIAVIERAGPRDRRRCWRKSCPK